MRIDLDFTQPERPEVGQVWISTVLNRVVALAERLDRGWWRVEEAGHDAIGGVLIEERVLLERYHRVGRLREVEETLRAMRAELTKEEA